MIMWIYCDGHGEVEYTLRMISLVGVSHVGC